MAAIEFNEGRCECQIAIVLRCLENQIYNKDTSRLTETKIQALTTGRPIEANLVVLPLPRSLAKWQSGPGNEANNSVLIHIRRPAEQCSFGKCLL